MSNEDVRWIQRFSNYRKALVRLANAIALTEERELSDLEQQGLIQGFEFTFDLAWNTLQDILRERNNPDTNGGPNVIITYSFENGYIKDYEGWKAMKKSRNLTSHSYDEVTADDIADKIVNEYHGLFIQLETRLQVEKINQEKNG
jgi:nucleotidyltransferase substrate binding protein, HI0074 family